MRLRKIISGGQTGADRAALEVAKSLGIETGGFMPAGFKALDGNHPEFAKLYGIKETGDESYSFRTSLNVRSANATVRFAKNFASRGEVCTLNFLRKYKKPYMDIVLSQDAMSSWTALTNWIYHSNMEVLNVAGNSEQTCPGIHEFVTEYLTFALKGLKEMSK